MAQKLHTHAHTHIDSAPPPPLPLLACCAAANNRICLRIARQKQHNENVDSSARKKEKKRARRSFCAIFATHTHTNTHSIKWPSPRLLALSRSLPRLRSFTMCFVHFGSRSLSRLTLTALLGTFFLPIVLPYIYHCVAHLRCVKRKRKTATCAASDVDGSDAASRQRVSAYGALALLALALSLVALRRFVEFCCRRAACSSSSVL